MAKIHALALLFMFCLALAAPGWGRSYSVSAYCHRTRTALGTRPRAGVCAGPRRLLGRYVRIAGWRYRVEDVCHRGFDIWLPSAKACRKFGRKHLTVQIGGRFRKK